jgi:uncharacterized protein YdhG (YjbR/CyaY superfamily)
MWDVEYMDRRATAGTCAGGSVANTDFKSVDQYIETFPASVQETLQTVRKAIREAAPEAEEAISYQIPVLKFHGPVFFFSAWKKHYSLHPAGSVADVFADELAGYVVTKGTIRFPYDRPVPVQLITAMAKHRVAENVAAAEAKAAAKERKR